MTQHFMPLAGANLFIAGGSFMASSARQNPLLTDMAFTARACEYAVQEMKKLNTQ
jgi:choline dehydrogenase-like flavoprotein